MQTVDAGKNKYSKRAVGVLGFAAAVLFSFILFYAAAYTALYADADYYEREYLKYDVISFLPVEMTMSEEDGVMAVSDHMMDYLLHGDDPYDLQIAVTIDGETRDFFTEREIAHMADVREIFKTAQEILIVCIIAAAAIAAVSRLVLYKRTGRKDYLISAGTGLAAGTLAVMAAIAGLTALVCSNFSSAFITFHHIFFDNDLWLLDPYEDLMINLLPESFFADTALRIVVLYIVFMILMTAAGVLIRIYGLRVKNDGP